jgi:prepilin-type N-terminal cleavage/methylation domain-containing protein
MIKLRRKLKLSQKGFTLVEVAIVMIIIGLLIGGVIKGQAMIHNAKVKRLIKDIDGMRAAVYAYEDRFGMLPGDESDPNTPTGDTNNGNNNGQFNETDGWEVADMRLAGILSGTGNTLPTHAFGGTIRVDYVNIAGGARNYITLTNVPAEVAQEIDTKYDDGIRNTGEIRGNANYTAGTVIGTFGWEL